MASCDHSGHIETDVSGRRVCTECGEVIGGFDQIIEDRFEHSTEFQIIPKLSTFGEGVSEPTNATIDAVCDHCEKLIGSRLSPELKQRVMRLVESYRQASGVRQLYSYENSVRTAMLVVLRSAGYTVDPVKLIPRFDEKRTPMFRLLSRMQSVMGVRMEPVSSEVLVRHVVENLLRDMSDRGFHAISFMGQLSADTAEDAMKLATSLMQAMGEYGKSGTVPKISQALACSYAVVRFGSEFPPTVGKRDFTLKTAIVANDLSESEKIVYRDFDTVRDFIHESLVQAGFRGNNERTFLVNFDFIIGELRKRAEVQRRIADILSP